MWLENEFINNWKKLTWESHFLIPTFMSEIQEFFPRLKVHIIFPKYKLSLKSLIILCVLSM